MSIINQDKILQRVDSSTLDTLPQTILLEGPLGSGKHLIYNYIKDKFSFEGRDITEEISKDTIDTLDASSAQFLILIEGQKLSEREQNVILKFIEEPERTSHIVILCENVNNILPTVVNRCQVWRLNPYNKEQLRMFSTDELVLELAKTPGDAIKLEQQKAQLPNMIHTCNSIFDRMYNASFGNVLRLVSYLALDNEQDLYDVDTFFRVLLYVNKKKIQEQPSLKLQQAYNLTKDLCVGYKIPHINVQALYENYLLKMKMLLVEN